MLTHHSRYFQTLEFIFRVSKGLLVLTVLLGFLSFFIIQKYHKPNGFIEGTIIAEKKSNIFFIKSHEKITTGTVGQLHDQVIGYTGRKITNFGGYCNVLTCDTIECSSIPATHDPGNITSAFIQSVFKDRCPDTYTITLIYKGCKFPSNTLQKNWLKIDLSIRQITFQECSLNRIDDEAFSETIFSEVETLSLFNNRITSLNRNIFKQFVKLKKLLVENNIIDYAESDLLASVANSLEDLQLDGVIKEREVLRNITGKRILSNLQKLSIRYNVLSILGPELFEGVPNVVSLFVDNSKVMKIRPNSFRPMAASLQQLFLLNNEISTLPNDIFNSALISKKNFNVYLAGNIWHCDCELQWIQEFIRNYPSVIRDTPRCKTPELNAQLLFVEAKFCNENSMETTTQNVEITSQKDSSTDRNSIDVICNGIVSNNYRSSKVVAKKLQFVDYTFSTIFRNFTLTELQDGTVLVALFYLEKEETVLLWFDNQMQEDNRRSIHCAKNVKESYLLKDTSPRTSYTVCLADNQEDGFSPLNCLGITTKPSLEDRAWLTNKYKTVVCLISTALLLFLCAISALCMFITVRRHPSLLQGSKRVILVKHRNLKAMVLPKGANIDEANLKGRPVRKISAETKFYTEDGYVTPIPPSRLFSRKDSRRTSRISFQSYGASYVSSIEPAFWTLGKSKSEIGADDIAPPPVPPYPRCGVPSVSMAIDSINIKDDEDDLKEVM